MTINNTTTVLNPGASGDSMDESLAPQPVDYTQPATTQTSAKRPRVVLGDDLGNLLGLQLVGGVWMLPVVTANLEEKLDQMLLLLERMNQKLGKIGGIL